MAHAYWNDWYFSLGLGFFGSDLCSCCFRALETGAIPTGLTQKFDKPPRKEAFDILDTRYGKGRDKPRSIQSDEI